MSRVGRPQIEYDVDEVNEIIEKKLKSVDGDISKLSYNSVNQFNKLLIKKKVQNYKGKAFTDYGSYFWSGLYLGKPSFGKERIDFFKKHKEIMPLGNLYEIDTSDIELIFYNDRDNIETIKRRMINIFKKERSSNVNNEKMFIQMQKEIQRQRTLIKQYQEAIYMMFYNSQYCTNSLDDVISIKNVGNKIMMDELNNIFDSDMSILDYIHSRNNNNDGIKNKLETNIINMADILSKNKDD